CNTLRTKVKRVLTQNPKMGENRVVEQGEDHQGHHQCKAESKSDFLHTHTEGFPPHSFDQIIHQVPAVEHGDRQQVKNADIERQQGHEVDERNDAQRRHFARNLGDLDRATQLLDITAPDEEV